MVEGWRCSSEVEHLSSKIGKRDPEFTPQNKQRKGRVGGGNNERGSGLGVGHWQCAVTPSACISASPAPHQTRKAGDMVSATVPAGWGCAQWVQRGLGMQRPWARFQPIPLSNHNYNGKFGMTW